MISGTQVPNGTEVLIFDYISEWGTDQNYDRYIKGKIIKCELSDDLSYHGSSWHVYNYTVLGEDGREYFGNYGSPVLGGHFFLTKEGLIKVFKNKMAWNQRNIDKLVKENEEYEKKILKLEGGMTLKKKRKVTG